MSQLADAVFLVVYPELACLWARREFKQLRAFTLRLSLAMFAVAVVLYGTTFFAVPWVIAWLMRAEFADAGLIFRCMGWGIILSAPFVWVYPFLLAAGRTDLNLWAALSSTVIVVLLYLTAIPYAGPVGAALVYALSMPINLALMLWLGRRAGVIFPSSIAPPVSPP
jgi:O-antigen/teichoic acid export membrane protein